MLGRIARDVLIDVFRPNKHRQTEKEAFSQRRKQKEVGEFSTFNS